MVSKASEDLPDPDSPVITVTAFRGISKLMFLRLCWRGPRTMIFVIPLRRGPPPLSPLPPRGDPAARANPPHSHSNFPGQRAERFEAIKKALSSEVFAP